MNWKKYKFINIVLFSSPILHVYFWACCLTMLPHTGSSLGFETKQKSVNMMPCMLKCNVNILYIACFVEFFCFEQLCKHLRFVLCAPWQPLCWNLHLAPVLPPPSFLLLCPSSVPVPVCSLSVLFVMLVIPWFLVAVTLTEFFAVSLQFAVVDQCHHILVPWLGGDKCGAPHN